MRYSNVFLEAIAYSLPSESVSSRQIEERLGPLYERLRLPEGRLEMMTGIASRRIWPADMLPSQASSRTAEELLSISHVDPNRIGALVHASVCRDHLEPATACIVHARLGLSSQCVAYDVSNACLGMLNGMVQVANMIQLGQIDAGIVVGCEHSRGLLETTIRYLNENEALSRKEVKPAMASLTIGSASAAVLLVSEALTQSGTRLLGGVHRIWSDHCKLCYSSDDQTGPGQEHPLMWTDAENLMHEGIRAASDTFADFLSELQWDRRSIDRVFCHQVGRAHQKLLLETLRLDRAKDFVTYPFLGNTGSAALPITAAIGAERGVVRSGDRVGLFGIGSGINVILLGVEWNRVAVGCAGSGEPVSQQRG